MLKTAFVGESIHGMVQSAIISFVDESKRPKIEMMYQFD